MASARSKRWLCVAAVALAASLVGAAPLDSAVIVDSGSTNTAGYRVEVRSDGSATVSVQQNRNASPGPATPFHVSADTAKKLFADLAAARSESALTVPCMKSASFGSTVKVTWQGWTSSDLTCPPKDSVGQSLIDDVSTIRQASGVKEGQLHSGPIIESPKPPNI
jgi:hypothetical protein